MKDAMLFLLPLAIVILLAMPLIPVYRGIKTGKKAKHAIVFNLCAFAGVCLAAIMLSSSSCGGITPFFIIPIVSPS